MGPIVGFLSPTYKTQLMICLGIIDLNSIFCFKFGTIVHSLTLFVTIVTRRLLLVEQELPTLSVHLSSSRFLVVLRLLDL